MTPITSRDISFNSGDSMKMRLGDILILRSPLKAINKGDLSAFMPLAVLVVGLFADDIYFTLLGLDVLKYSISKHTKRGLVLLSGKGKETKMSEDNIVQLFKTFGRNKSVDTIDGLRLYLRTLITDASHLKISSVYKISKRLIDMADWPDAALITWANKHLRVPSQHIPAIEHLDNKQLMINHMLRLGISRAKIFSGKNKAIAEAQANCEEVSIANNTIDSERLSWDRSRAAYRRMTDASSDHVIYYRGEAAQINQHNVDMGQQERIVVQNMGEPAFEMAVGPAVEWRTDPPGEVFADPIALSTIDPPGTVENESILYDEEGYYEEDDPDEMR